MHFQTWPYPVSFQGSGALYWTALWSLLATSCLSMMVAGWMSRDIWRDRHTEYLTNPVSMFRLVIMLCAGTTFIRSLPEATYLLLYNEQGTTTAGLVSLVLLIKRALDTVSIAPFVIAMAILVISYPALVTQLKHRAIRGDLLTLWPNLVPPALVLVLTGLIAGLVTVGKAVQ